MTELTQALKTLAFNLEDMKGEEEVEGVDGNHFARGLGGGAGWGAVSDWQ